VTGANATADASAWSTVYADPHWQSPILVNGRIYLIDGNSSSNGSSLWVYQLDGTFRDGFDRIDASAPVARGPRP
jgi:hypothetical protein